ncbi:MAG: adenosylcobinamide-GDP ribazoletransferase [Candidatus Nanopelagicales bacterium]
MSAARLCLGLFTIIPAGAVPRVDRDTARAAMLLAPIAGVILGVLAATVLAVISHLIPTSLGALLAAALAIGSLTYLTRALHLDGLADTTDALGSGRRGQEALDIARRADVGPFAVVTVVLLIVIDIAALAAATAAGIGPIALVIAVVTGRLAATVGCTRGIPAASPTGLGALVAGTIPRVASVAWVIVIVIGAFGVGMWLGATGAWAMPLAVVVGLALALAVVARCVRRLGGITGDVLGASVEVATTAALVALALGASVSP